MEESYCQRLLQKMENKCLLYMQKAHEEFMMNGGHTKQEYFYLQKAAVEREKIASVSTGEEKIYQQKELAKLNNQIDKAIRNDDLTGNTNENIKSGDLEFINMNIDDIISDVDFTADDLNDFFNL